MLWLGVLVQASLDALQGWQRQFAGCPVFSLPLIVGGKGAIATTWCRHLFIEHTILGGWGTGQIIAKHHPCSSQQEFKQQCCRNHNRWNKTIENKANIKRWRMSRTMAQCPCHLYLKWMSTICSEECLIHNILGQVGEHYAKEVDCLRGGQVWCSWTSEKIFIIMRIFPFCGRQSWRSLVGNDVLCHVCSNTNRADMLWHFDEF